MSSSTATIAEIAARAGVGTATVDRVLNKRPGVNADTVLRVLQVVAEIGTPPLRGRPRRDANLRFAFVLPADDTPFLELVDRQIAHRRATFATSTSPRSPTVSMPSTASASPPAWRRWPSARAWR